MMDLIVYADRRPGPGETVFGRQFKMTPGGKGFNQAIAAARAGASASMVGRVGDDQFGREFLTALEEEGVGVSGLAVTAEVGTGVGLPVVESNGDNSIVVVPRANFAVTREDVEQASEHIASATIVLLQLELPVETQLAAARVASGAGRLVAVNTAPAVPLPTEFMSLIDVLIANEEEILVYGNSPSCEASIRDVRAMYPDMSVIVTIGELGALVSGDGDGDEIVRYEAPSVRVEDTVGAGDVFCGYFIAARAEGLATPDAVTRAVHAASLSVTEQGSGLSIPTRAQTQAFMAARGSAL
jgi:ribokinase